jgi:hypothetical protein
MIFMTKVRGINIVLSAICQFNLDTWYAAESNKKVSNDDIVDHLVDKGYLKDNANKP